MVINLLIPSAPFGAIGKALAAWLAALLRRRKGTEMIERRATYRRRTYLGGCVTFEKPRSTDDCLVRDLSEAGARVAFSGSTPIPNVFDLMIRETGETRPVRVVWRKALQAGVVFEAAAPALAPAAAQRIRRLEADREVLLRRLARAEEPVG
jgi:hypothetical protein